MHFLFKELKCTGLVLRGASRDEAMGFIRHSTFKERNSGLFFLWLINFYPFQVTIVKQVKLKLTFNNILQ